MKNALEYFIVYLMAPLVLIIGLVGNTLGTLVLSKQKLIKMGSIHTLRYLLLIDSVYLLMIIQPYAAFSFGMDFTLISDRVCKLFKYFNYSLDVISPWLLVFVSFDKLVSIKTPARKDILRKTKCQRLYLLVIFVFNMIYYLPFAYFSVLTDSEMRLVDQNRTVIVRSCSFVNSRAQRLLSLMDIVNRALIPFTLMSLFTLLIIQTVFESRNRVIANYTFRQNKTFQRDVKFAITAIILNVVYFLFSLLVSVLFFMRNHNTHIFVYLFTLYLFYMCYAVNFYLILISNSIFRNEFFSMLRALCRQDIALDRSADIKFRSKRITSV